VPEDCTNPSEFLQCFSFPLSLLQTYEGLREAAYLVAEDMRSQGVIYGEIRYAPQLHTTGAMSQEDAIQAVLEGVRKSGIKVNVILCCMRGDDNDDANLETLELARKYLVEDGGVVALDLAGAEALFPTSSYRDLFAKARKYGIPFTIHAGEADGAQSVALAIEYGATRIGHGVRSFEDVEVLKQLKEKGIFLEMCPTSNRQTVAVKDMSTYPFIDYLNQGINVTLNTDDPGIEGTTLEKEYLYMEDTFGLTDALEKTLLENSISAAFTNSEVKRQLMRSMGLSSKTDPIEDIAVRIDSLLSEKASARTDHSSNNDIIIVAIDGRCGAGKTTLAAMLQEKYDCNVFHMDDFFLRPEQRSDERLSVPGENVDHERFLKEVLMPLSENSEVTYQRYDCHSQLMEDAITVPKKRLNIIEGVYSFHPDLFSYYDLTVFLDVSYEIQKERIQERNTPEMAQRFLDTWIPLEEKYFKELKILEKAEIVIR